MKKTQRALRAASQRRLPALEGAGNPCLHCPPIRPVLDMRRRIAVGFGYAALLCDGKAIWTEQQHDYADCLSVRQAENRALKKPRADWKIVLDGPMHGETYQRQGKGRWVLVEKNQGFA